VATSHHDEVQATICRGISMLTDGNPQRKVISANAKMGRVYIGRDRDARVATEALARARCKTEADDGAHQGL
jgi:hypothetical protein